MVYKVGFVSSLDGGATWTPPTQVTPHMSLSWIASTNQGRMVGDYMSTSFTADGKAHPVFSWAKALDGGANCSTTTLCRQRLATASFDPTAPQVSPRVRAGRERPVGHKRSHRLKLLSAY